MCLLQIPCICTFSILNYTKMHGSSAEVLPKIHWSICECAKVELLQVYFRYTLNVLRLNNNIIQRSYNPHQ